YCIVEFGHGRLKGFFIKGSLSLNIKKQDYVIVEGDRGLDFGKVIQLDVSRYRIEIVNKKEKVQNLILRMVLRLATDEDIKQHQKNKHMAKEAGIICRKEISRQKLPVDLVVAEYQWDQEKITFFFNSNSRVDFRQLVVFLYNKFRARIWM
ncbi:PSP1 C-terminal conserved region-domain-containing protein, partial [Phycomyces nitens]